MVMFIRTLRHIRRTFLSAREGSIMVLTGMMVPVVAGATVFAVDHMMVAGKVAGLQRAADAAAIATARELHFIGSGMHEGGTTLSAIAQSYARQTLPDEMLTAVAATESDTLVTVDLALTLESPLSRVFSEARTFTARAKAEIYGGQNICIIASEAGDSLPGIQMSDDAEIRAGTCGIYSNSAEPDSIVVKGSAHIEANFICSAGGYEGGEGSFSTDVTTDCAQIKDPLADRPDPEPEGCLSGAASIVGGVVGETMGATRKNLHPGTYCGGFTVNGDMDIFLMPGEYIFKDGPVIVEGNAKIKGENVGLHFYDTDSYFEFRGNSEIDISAPETGPMAGIVISARDVCDKTGCPTPRRFVITSANVRSLLGTINLPKDELLIDTTMPISEEAAFTILIVENLIMQQSPSLILNTDYAATTVPVPEGFEGKTSTRLIE